MRAVRFDGEFLRVATNAADPLLAPGEALVHPTRVLIGPADLTAVVPGSATRHVGVVGHQFVGVVKRVNVPDDAGPLQIARKKLVGKRVVGSPLLVCTHCDMCRAGLPSHCRARKVMGLATRDGCFADLFAIPLSNLVEVPPAMTDERAVFAHLASSAVQAGQMLRAASKSYISVIGDSPLAMLTAQALARHNRTTRLLYTRPECAKLCERWGMKCRGVEEPGRRQDQDVVIECSGTTAGLTLALKLVRPRGMVVLKSGAAGVPYPPGYTLERADASLAVDLMPAIANEIQLLGCREASIADGLGALTDSAVEIDTLIGRRFAMDDAISAYAAAAQNPCCSVVMEV